jgi:hypothetical protein
MDVLFVAGVSPIVRDSGAARAFYRDALGLSFEGGEGDTSGRGVLHALVP